jgi:hypothetical protein
VDRKKTPRLYREEGLSVRKRRGRKKAKGTRAPLLKVAAPNALWSVDFVHDQFAQGRRFRIFNVIDDVTMECPAAVVGFRVRSSESRAPQKVTVPFIGETLPTATVPSSIVQAPETESAPRAVNAARRSSPSSSQGNTAPEQQRPRNIAVGQSPATCECPFASRPLGPGGVK